VRRRGQPTSLRVKAIAPENHARNDRSAGHVRERRCTGAKRRSFEQRTRARREFRLQEKRRRCGRFSNARSHSGSFFDQRDRAPLETHPPHAKSVRAQEPEKNSAIAIQSIFRRTTDETMGRIEVADVIRREQKSARALHIFASDHVNARRITEEQLHEQRGRTIGK